MGRPRGLICGIGVNDADYITQKKKFVNGKWVKIEVCPYYRKWTNMLERCYSEQCQIIRPTYKDCEVCEEWRLFSNFKSWMEKQDWEGKALDKDLLVDGNKVYSPDTCVFVDCKVNNFIKSDRVREYMVGVSWNKNAGKFESYCNNPITGKRKYLGLFLTEIEAHLAWKKEKHKFACMLADSELVSDPRLAEALRTRYL